MNNDQYSYYEGDDENRQFFNFPGFFGIPGFGGGNQPPWQGGGPSSQFPGQGGGPFPGGQPPAPPVSGPQQESGPPTSPPPSFTPQQPKVQTLAVDPGAIRGCLFQFTYVWLRRDAFWFFPVYVGRQSIAGYRWNRFRWVYFGIDLDRIQSFQCY